MSPLRCLDFTILDEDFRDVLRDIAGSKRLERMVIREILINEPSYRQQHIQVLVDAIPLLKVKEITLWILGNSRVAEELEILTALKKNYVVQSVQCKNLAVMVAGSMKRIRLV